MSADFYINAPSRASRSTSSTQVSTESLIDALQASIATGAMPNGLAHGGLGADANSFLAKASLLQRIMQQDDNPHRRRDPLGVQRLPEVPRMPTGGHF